MRPVRIALTSMPVLQVVLQVLQVKQQAHVGPLACAGWALTMYQLRRTRSSRMASCPLRCCLRRSRTYGSVPAGWGRSACR